MTLGRSSEVPKRSGPPSGSARAAVTNTLARRVKWQTFLTVLEVEAQDLGVGLAGSVSPRGLQAPPHCVLTWRKERAQVSSSSLRVPVPSRGVGLSDHIEAQHLPNAPNPNSTRLGAGVSTHEFGVHELVHSSSLLMWGGSEQLGLNERVAGSSRKCRRLLGLPLGPRLAAVPPSLSREHGDGLWPGVLVSPPVASLGTPVSSSPRPCPRLGTS